MFTVTAFCLIEKAIGVYLGASWLKAKAVHCCHKPTIHCNTLGAFYPHHKLPIAVHHSCKCLIKKVTLVSNRWLTEKEAEVADSNPWTIVQNVEWVTLASLMIIQNYLLMIKETFPCFRLLSLKKGSCPSITSPNETWRYSPWNKVVHHMKVPCVCGLHDGITYHISTLLNQQELASTLPRVYIVIFITRSCHVSWT